MAAGLQLVPSPLQHKFLNMGLTPVPFLNNVKKTTLLVVDGFPKYLLFHFYLPINWLSSKIVTSP